MKKAYLLSARLFLCGLLLIGIGLPSALAQPANDQCVNAITLAIGGSDSGSTATATDNNPPTCGGAGDGNSGGVWYRVVGNGGTIIASLCGSGFDTQLAVYSGSCAALACVTGNDDSSACSPSTRSQVSWPSTSGVSYYLYVDGFSAASGAYTITISTPPPPPANDDCITAAPISVGGSASGSTSLADDDNPPSCPGGATLDNAGGVWYVVVGTGLDITASLCGSGYDTQMDVYTGSCSALACIAGNDDFCGLQSQVTWNSLAGVSYYVYVHGYSTATGSYILSVTGDLPPPIDNDNCSMATPISCGETVQGSTIGAFPDNVRRCGPGTAGGGVWYTFNATEGGIVQSLSTCGAANFDTKISIYYGTCSGLRCIGSLDNSEGCPNGTTEMFFTPYFGRTHYVLVQTVNPAAPGVFELTYDCDASAARPAGVNVLVADESEAFETISLFPNPAQDELNVELSGFTGDQVTMRVHNSLGQVVMQRNINQVEEQIERFNTSNLQSGIYYLTVQAQGKATLTEKFMVGGSRP